MDDSKKLVRFVEVKKILFYYETGELGRMVRLGGVNIIIYVRYGIPVAFHRLVVVDSG